MRKEKQGLSCSAETNKAVCSEQSRLQVLSEGALIRLCSNKIML